MNFQQFVCRSRLACVKMGGLRGCEVFARTFGTAESSHLPPLMLPPSAEYGRVHMGHAVGVLSASSILTELCLSVLNTSMEWRML